MLMVEENGVVFCYLLNKWEIIIIFWSDFECIIFLLMILYIVICCMLDVSCWIVRGCKVFFIDQLMKFYEDVKNLFLLSNVFD